MEKSQMRVDIYDVDQDTGTETLAARNVAFSDCFDMDDNDEARAALDALHEAGEAMVGGGAAPLVRLSVTLDTGTSGVFRITPTAEVTS